MSSEQDTPIRKFQGLLRELFQFDCADLDFGIYRIMNHKRDVVERFITTKLPETLNAELGTGALNQQTKANAVLANARRHVVELLGPDAIDATGEIAPTLVATPVAKAYLEAKAQAGTSRSRTALEADVYNHLYTFFGRYYQDGDFISKRRYSGRHRYAIPYNGEEVYLHWANSDQYYVKTAEHFHHYRWKSPIGVTVHFRVDSATVQQNNVKGERRFFVPLVVDATWGASSRTLTVPFTYRPLDPAEQAAYGRSNQQDKIIAAAVVDLSKRFDDPDALAALLGERHRNAGDEPITHLEYHLRQYMRRNDSDFFIHKDLRSFLSQELDFYLKNEVLNLNDLSAAGEHAAEGWFHLLQLIKLIGGQIIDFLAQIEEFQKTLWEKRKFVTETQYCVALRCVPTELYEEVAANEAQWVEWQSLALTRSEPTNLFNSCNTQDERMTVLETNPTLMLDTAHFTPSFIDRLIATFADLDQVTDGVLLHSENWQALQFLQQYYSNGIKCVYIDPPYNTDSSAILYKNDYKDSSWLSLMENRLLLAKTLMLRDGVLCCAIDDEEAWRSRALLQSLFQKEMGVAPVRSTPIGRTSRGKLSPTHEYALFYSGESTLPGWLAKTDREMKRYPYSDARGRYAWRNLIRTGTNDRRIDRPKLYYPIFVSRDDVLRVPQLEWLEESREYKVLDKPRDNEVVVWPVKRQNANLVEKNWERGWQRVSREASEYRVSRRDTPSGEQEISIHFIQRMDISSVPKTWWGDSRYASSNHGAKVLKDMFVDNPVDFPKSVALVKDCILTSGGWEKTAAVLDYFAGSGTTGHAVVNLNREDGGKRKFILVEMGEHFDTVLLPRLKKITFSPEWHAGRPTREATPEEAERSPRIIKYTRLESYEDALDSIQFDEPAGQLKLEDRIEGYLFHYMLQWETKDSETLLNPAQLASPFDYRLRVHTNGSMLDRPVDVANTFNYLLGLKVRTRRVYMDEDRRYLVFRGETRDAAGRLTVVIWRDTTGWAEPELKRDRAFVAQQKIMDDADTVFVNGLSCIVGARPIEPLFKARMFAGVSTGS